MSATLAASPPFHGCASSMFNACLPRCLYVCHAGCKSDMLLAAHMKCLLHVSYDVCMYAMLAASLTCCWLHTWNACSTSPTMFACLPCWLQVWHAAGCTHEMPAPRLLRCLHVCHAGCKSTHAEAFWSEAGVDFAFRYSLPSHWPHESWLSLYCICKRLRSPGIDSKESIPPSLDFFYRLLNKIVYK